MKSEFPSYINRSGYIEKIKPFIGKNLIKVIVGQRRIGKSYLLFQLMDIIKGNEPHANIIYINKENYEFENIQNYKHLVKYVNELIKLKVGNYLFIDEIQDISEFEKALRHFALDK